MKLALLLPVLVAFLVSSASCQSQPQLVYVQQLFRHGARYPQRANKDDNSSYARREARLGELTKQGKSMHYLLGHQLFEEYWDRLFGDLRQYNQSKFYVKSTDVNRTIQSAQSQLVGIFENLWPLEINQDQVSFSMPNWQDIPLREPGKVFTNSPWFQTIPIHVEKGPMNPWSHGDFLRSYSSAFCYSQDKWIAQNINSPKVLSILKNPQIQTAFRLLKQQLNKDISFWDIHSYLSSATAETYANRPTLTALRPDSPHYHTFMFIYIFDLFAKYYSNEQQIAATATGYFNETTNHFRRIENDTSGVQWAFYSAHDSTIGNFLARLNMTNIDCQYDNFLKGRYFDSESDTCILQFPNYASTLIFEVHRYQNGSHVMRIRYNGMYRTIPFCGYKTECTLEQYYDWYDSWKDENFEESCGVTDSYKEEARTYFALMVVFIALVITLGVYYVVKRLQRKQKESVVPSAPQQKKDDKESAEIVRESLISQDQVEHEV